MKKKEREIENLIYSELNAEKPDESVLNSAKSQMAGGTEVKRQNYTTGGGAEQVQGSGAVIARKRAAAAICAVFAAAVILCCSLPLILRGEEISADGEFTPQEISSINSYGGGLLYLDYEIESSVLYVDSENSPVYILELYNDNQTQIKLYVLLDTTQTQASFLSNFDGLSDSCIYNGIAIGYGICGNEYAAAFTFNGCNYYLSADVTEDSGILYYAQELLKAG